jgi:hypothetical protein
MGTHCGVSKVKGDNLLAFKLYHALLFQIYR